MSKQPGSKCPMNHLKNGTRIRANRLVVGALPPELRSVQREGRAYRRALEGAVLDAHGSISVVHGHLIDSACAATVHAGICRWLMRERIGSMNTGDILACSKSLVQAKQSRDQAVKALNLDKPPADPWAAIDVKAKESK